MTAYQYEEYKLLCDSGDCRVRFGPKPAKRAEVRRMARKAGWTHAREPGMPAGSTRDYCPDHKPEEG
jgi:hypothetical protein